MGFAQGMVVGALVDPLPDTPTDAQEEILDAIVRCDGGRTVPLDKVLSDLRNDE